MKKELVVVMGPTAVGKTAYCIAKAKAEGTEIVSADSRQFYQEMFIGTARPSTEEMQGVPHHFVGSHSIHSPLNVASYEQVALARIEELFKIHSRVILTGGSGLYLSAVYRGLDPMPPSDQEVRQELEMRLEAEGLTALVQEIQSLDPVFSQNADLQNPRRVIRALEVCKVSGKPYSSFLGQEKAVKKRSFEVKKIILTRPTREELYARINQRVLQMMDAGLLEEAKSLFHLRHLVPLQTVGYQELFSFLEGKYSLDEAVSLIQRNTRRYAKRQLTWFRKEKNAIWIELLEGYS